MPQSLHDRLKAARMAAGYAKAVHAAQKYGWNISTFRAHENGQNSFDFATAQAYAQAFGVSVNWLLTGEGGSSTRFSNQSNTESSIAFDIEHDIRVHDPVFITGLVGEGYWVSNDVIHTPSEFIASPFPPDPRFPASRQFDLKLLGNQALPYGRDGEIVRCISVEKPESDTKTNDLLVIETRKNDLIERKLRILSSASGDMVLLNFDGSSHIEPFFTGQSIMGETITVVGKVLYKYEFAENFSSRRPL